jgi:glycosyltransferase involved in cell wall biosynthesis
MATTIMNKIRVVHIVPILSPGGAERVAVHIVRGLNRNRYEPLVVALGKRVGCELDQLIERDGIDARYLGKSSGFDFRMYSRLHRVLRDFQPNIVHTHLQVLRYALPSMLLLRRTFLLHTVHNLAEREIEPLARWIHRHAFRHGVVPVAVAEVVARSIKALYGIEQCEVISNGIPTEYYGRPQTTPSEWRAKLRFRDDDFLFVCVARFAPQKNHELLLRAFAQSLASQSKTHLLLIGEGALQKKLEDQANNLGLFGRIHFLGMRTDIPDVLGAADAFVLSSDYEGNPLSVMEAMAAGLPIISTAAGGVPNLFEHGKQGLIVRPGDVQGLSTSMKYFVGNPEARHSFGIAAARRAKVNFDVSTMVKAYEDLYVQLVDGPRRVDEVRERQDSVVTAESR